MISKADYFSQSRHALDGLFSLLGQYEELFSLTVPPMRTFRHSGAEGEFEAMYTEWRNIPDVIEGFDLSEYAREEVQGSRFSMNVIAGSILQIACKAIEQYSTNKTISLEKSHFYGGIKRPKPEYAVGREIRGIPLGLVVLAARNQYNHIESDSEMKQPAKTIFEALCTYEDPKWKEWEIDGADNEEVPFRDPSFDLKNPRIVCYSFPILKLIGWKTRADLMADLEEMTR